MMLRCMPKINSGYLKAYFQKLYKQNISQYSIRQKMAFGGKYDHKKARNILNTDESIPVCTLESTVTLSVQTVLPHKSKPPAKPVVCTMPSRQ